MKLVKICITVLLILYAFFFALYLLVPQYRSFYYREDGLAESLTALCFLISGLVGTQYIIKIKSFQWPLALLAGIGFLGFLDEISFGRSFVKYNRIAILGKPIDSIHDVVDLIYLSTFKTIGTMPTLLILLGLIVIVTGILFLYRNEWIKELKKIEIILVIFYIGLIVILFVVSIVVDLEIFSVETDAGFMVEEVSELSAAVVYIFLVVSIAKSYLANREADHSIAN